MIIHGLNAISIFSKEAIVRIIIFTLLISIILFLTALITLYLRIFASIFIGQASAILGILFIIFILILSNSFLLSLIYNSKESENINRELSYKDYIVIDKNIN